MSVSGLGLTSIVRHVENPTMNFGAYMVGQAYVLNDD